MQAMSETITRAEWEIVNDTAKRLLVPGGWLYRTFEVSLTGYEIPGTVALAFVPRPEGWEP